MPVNRAFIEQFAYSEDQNTIDLFQALTQLANFSDALESATGVNLSPSSSSQSAAAAAPASGTWSVTGASGQFTVQLTPDPSVTAPVQYQIQSAVDQNFDANSSVQSFTLGFGQQTLTIVDPGSTKFFRMQCRTQGSGWSTWLMYADATGVTAVVAGSLP